MRPGVLVTCLAIAGCAGASASSGDLAPETSPARDTGRLLALNGTQLFVRTLGAGEPAIVVHGGPVLDHGYLADHLGLDDALRLTYFDQRLSGRSAGTVDSASVRIDTLAADIDAVRAHIGAERVHVIGHSWGGLLALRYAILHPERVRSLILVSPTAPTTALWQDEQRAAGGGIAPEDTAGLGALRNTDAFRRQEPAAIEAVLRYSFRSELHDRAQSDRLRFHIEPNYASRSRQFGYILPDLLSFDFSRDIRGLTVPTLIVYGADEVGPRIGGAALMQGLPRAQLVVIPDAGHFAFLEQPAAFREAVTAFLANTRR